MFGILKSFVGGRSPAPSPAESPSASRGSTPPPEATFRTTLGGPILNFEVIDGPPLMKDMEAEGVEFKLTMVFDRLYAPMTQDRTTSWACLDFDSAPLGSTMRITIWKLVSPESGEWVHAANAETLFRELSTKYGVGSAIVGLYDKARCRDEEFVKKLTRFGPYGTQPPRVNGHAVAAPERSETLGITIPLRSADSAPPRPAVLDDAPPREDDFGAVLAVERARTTRLRQETERLQRELDEARSVLATKPSPGAELAGARAELEEAKVEVRRLSEESSLHEQRLATAKSRADRAEADLRSERKTLEDTYARLEEAREDRCQAEAYVRSLQTEVEALRCARSEVSPVQLETALRRTKTAEEAYAKMAAIAKEESDKAGEEVLRRTEAEREVVLKQTIRDLRDKFDAYRTAALTPEAALRREIDELKRQLRERSDSRGGAGGRDVSPQPVLAGAVSVSVESRELSLPVAPATKTKADYLREEEAKNDASLVKPWRNLHLKIQHATARIGGLKADAKPYEQFIADHELVDMVARLMRALVSQTWTQETLPLLHLTADVKTVLATYVALVAFETHWDPTMFKKNCRWLLPKDGKQISTEEALNRALADFLAIDTKQVPGWCMGRSLELLQSHWGFELEAFRREEGPPVCKDATVAMEQAPHLFACLYDMVEAKPAERDPRLLGDVGPKRMRLPLVPPRRLTVPHPVNKSTVIHLSWEWPASPTS